MVAAGQDLSKPPRKRQRQEKTSQKSEGSTNRLFAPFRALGLVTNHVPFVLQARSFKGATDGPRIHLLTCLGKSWALWEGGKMTLLFVGPECAQQITSLAMDGDSVYAATGADVVRYVRAKEVSRFTNPLASSLSHMIIFGSQVLALTEDGNRMLTWDRTSGGLKSTVQFDKGFTAVLILHPATYLNKILIASAEGEMQLWNIESQTCLHKFSLASLTTSSSTFNTRACSISSLVQSPALDVIAIGFTSGEISVYDIRTDERLMRMVMDSGSVRTIGFRTDGHPIMASASSAGHLALWDLDSGGKLLHMVRGAHDSAISAIEWVPGQPVLVTSGDDNSVKQWLFDSPTSPPRLLKFRAGHHAPPHLIRFYGDDGKQLLTASRDRSFRCTSIVRDSRSFELSQGSLAKKAASLSIPIDSLKFPHVTSISYSTARSKDWDDIVTGHSDETFARTWTMQSKRLGSHSLGFSPDVKGKGKELPPLGSVKAVCVTSCGNFALAGSSTGSIHMWNMQSGIKRRSFALGPPPAEIVNRSMSSGKKSNVTRCVTGLATDSLNRTVVASTLDGTINFFDFHTTKLDHTLVLPSAAVTIQLQRDSGLLAAICDDLVVRVVDIETRRVVRELQGFHGRVIDMTFSADSRWLLTTSLDCIIRTFDLPTGRLIDAFRTPSVATSISFSPTNDFLATAHVDSVGIYLWANRAQYGDVSFQGVSDRSILDISLPSMQDTADDEALESLTALTVESKPDDVYSTPPQLEGDLITLTLLPRARWQTLLNLEVITQRNKPKEPPKAPEKAPFFLPTLHGVEPRFAPEAKEKESSKEKTTRRLDKIAAESESVFLKCLVEGDPTGDYEAFFIFAKTLSPAATELELRSLGSSLEHLELFITALIQRLLSHRDFEAVQTLENVFLRMHAEILIENEELQDKLTRLRDVHEKESQRILELLSSSLGTLGFIRATT